jgi:hypothetical protein
MNSMLDYIAVTAPYDAYSVMQSFDPALPRPQDSEQMAEYLRQFVAQEGERGLRALARIHPDRDLFAASFSDDEYDNANGERDRDRDRARYRDGHHCACGCGLSNMTALPAHSNFYGANGNGNGNSSSGESMHQSLTLLLGGALVMIVVTHALKALS